MNKGNLYGSGEFEKKEVLVESSSDVAFYVIYDGVVVANKKLIIPC